MNQGKAYEAKFRNWAKSHFDLVLRIPDYSQTKVLHAVPCDYLCIKHGRTYYFEVKSSKSKTSFPLSQISNNQRTMFHKLLRARVEKIYIAIYIFRQLYIISAKDILNYIEWEERKSLKISWLITHHTTDKVL